MHHKSSHEDLIEEGGEIQRVELADPLQGQEGGHAPELEVHEGGCDIKLQVHKSSHAIELQVHPISSLTCHGTP